MTFKIKKGKHNFSPNRLGFWWNRKSFKWIVKFDASCRYHLEGEDVYDINKLIGIGWIPHSFKLFKENFIHSESARFGWVYNVEKDKMDIYAYCYINKVRTWKFISSVSIGEIHNFTLTITDSEYLFTINNNEEVSISHTNNRKLQYLLTPYFGGTSLSPNSMEISIDRFKKI